MSSNRLAKALLEGDVVDPRAFIMAEPKSVREVCENYGLKFLVQRFPSKGEYDFSEHYVDDYQGLITMPRKLWSSLKGTFSTPEIRTMDPNFPRMYSDYIDKLYIYLQHEVDPGGAVPHFVNVYLNRTSLWGWRGRADTEQAMAEILERDFFKRLEAFLRRFRGFGMEDLWNALRKAKFLTRQR